MKDVLLPGLALAAAHAGDLDTLQAFVELVSSPLRDQASGHSGQCSHRGSTHSPGLTDSPKPHWAVGLHATPRALLEVGEGGPLILPSPVGDSPDLFLALF